MVQLVVLLLPTPGVDPHRNVVADAREVNALSEFDEVMPDRTGSLRSRHHAPDGPANPADSGPDCSIASHTSMQRIPSTAVPGTLD